MGTGVSECDIFPCIFLYMICFLYHMNVLSLKLNKIQNINEKKQESEVAQSCLTLRDPMDCSPPGSSVHGTFQLEWVPSPSVLYCAGASRPYATGMAGREHDARSALLCSQHITDEHSPPPSLGTQLPSPPAHQPPLRD